MVCVFIILFFPCGFLFVYLFVGGAFFPLFFFSLSLSLQWELSEIQKLPY